MASWSTPQTQLGRELCRSHVFVNHLSLLSLINASSRRQATVLRSGTAPRTHFHTVLVDPAGKSGLEGSADLPRACTDHGLGSARGLWAAGPPPAPPDGTSGPCNLGSALTQVTCEFRRDWASRISPKRSGGKRAETCFCFVLKSFVSNLGFN